MTLDDLSALGQQYRDLRARTEEARSTLYGAICLASLTRSESEIARAAGVTRMTVRKALGK